MLWRAPPSSRFTPVTVGGGSARSEDIRKLAASAGADKVSINYRGRELTHDVAARAADKFGTSASSSRSMPADAGARAQCDEWEIYTHGGRNPTGVDAVGVRGHVASSAERASCW